MAKVLQKKKSMSQCFVQNVAASTATIAAADAACTAALLPVVSSLTTALVVSPLALVVPLLVLVSLLPVLLTVSVPLPPPLPLLPPLLLLLLPAPPLPLVALGVKPGVGNGGGVHWLVPAKNELVPLDGADVDAEIVPAGVVPAGVVAAGAVVAGDANVVVVALLVPVVVVELSAYCGGARRMSIVGSGRGQRSSSN